MFYLSKAWYERMTPLLWRKSHHSSFMSPITYSQSLTDTFKQGFPALLLGNPWEMVDSTRLSGISIAPSRNTNALCSGIEEPASYNITLPGYKLQPHSHLLRATSLIRSDSDYWTESWCDLFSTCWGTCMTLTLWVGILDYQELPCSDTCPPG